MNSLGKTFIYCMLVDESADVGAKNTYLSFSRKRSNCFLASTGRYFEYGVGGK